MEGLHAPLAALLNRGIADSVSARALCHELEGKSLDVELDPPGIQARLTAAGGELLVSDQAETEADASLRGGLVGFNRLLFGDAQAALRSGAVNLSGDTEVAQQFQSLLGIRAPRTGRRTLPIDRRCGPLTRSDRRHVALPVGQAPPLTASVAVSQSLCRKSAATCRPAMKWTSSWERSTVWPMMWNGQRLACSDSGVNRPHETSAIAVATAGY